MPIYHLTHLDRAAYISSIAKIKDTKSNGFANMALKWWDRHFSWKAHGCVILSNEQKEHLCYIFYKIDRYHEYITIHNIFTPLKYRRKGYAHRLIGLVFDRALQKNVSRFRATCVPQSLDFYLSMGFVYWGINIYGDYYCDMPLPTTGLNALESMVEHSTPEELAGTHLNDILSKVKGNTEKLNDVQIKSHHEDTEKLKNGYLYDELMLLESAQKKS